MPRGPWTERDYVWYEEQDVAVPVASFPNAAELVGVRQAHQFHVFINDLVRMECGFLSSASSSPWELTEPVHLRSTIGLTPVPYVQDQVGHEDATTTLKIYAQVLRRRDRKRHGQAFDALMSNAVPSAASIMMPSKYDDLRGGDAGDMPTLPSGSGHRNEQDDNL